MGNSNILKGENLHKRFEGVVAVDSISCSLYEGEILGLVGENGAGKSTFVKLLVGEHLKEHGTIYYRDKEVNWRNSYDSMIDGVGLVHQKPYLVPELTAAENIFLGKEYTKNGIIDESRILKEAKALLTRYPINSAFDPRLIVNEMTAGQREITEILKVLSYNPKVLILDEPTASFTENESKKLISIIKKINREQNMSIIFISHRLEEVFDLCTRITVLRNGKNVGTVDKKDFNKSKIIHMIINRDLSEFYPSKSLHTGKCLFKVDNFNSAELKEISLTVNSGEIVGLYGLSGAGMTEFVESIFGIRKINSGNLFLKGIKLKNISISQSIHNGIYLVPEDRDLKGLFPNFNVKENLTIAHLDYLIPNFLIREKKEKQVVKKAKNDFNITFFNMNQEIHSLSGGNQQKVVIAKWLCKDCDVLILDDPTVGVDIGTKREIYLMLRELTKTGKGIIFVSSEILEIIGIADRVYTMRDGSISAELKGTEINQKNILEHVL